VFKEGSLNCFKSSLTRLRKQSVGLFIDNFVRWPRGCHRGCPVLLVGLVWWVIWWVGTCESAVCVRIESWVESGVEIQIRIESRIESAVGPRRGTSHHTTAVGLYRGAPLTHDVGVGAGERRRGRGSQRRAARRPSTMLPWRQPGRAHHRQRCRLARPIRFENFRIGLSLSNRIESGGRFEFESNLEASQVPSSCVQSSMLHGSET